MGTTWLSVPRDWISSFGDIVKFCARVVTEVLSLRVLKFFGEALRQAGILILGSALVIWGLAFILGLTCGIEGAYFNRSVGAPAYAGVFSAWWRRSGRCGSRTRSTRSRSWASRA
jgi:phospholipid/cholesterol/gamma-HCH transport system permease protein